VGDFAEGDSGLGHAVGAGVHAEEEGLLLAVTEAGEVVAVPVPGVFEWVVSAGDRIGEFELTKIFVQICGGFDERVLAHTEWVLRSARSTNSSETTEVALRSTFGAQL